MLFYWGFRVCPVWAGIGTISAIHSSMASKPKRARKAKEKPVERLVIELPAAAVIMALEKKERKRA